MASQSTTPPPNRDGDSPEPLEGDVTVIGSQSSITPHDYPAGLTSRELAHALRGEMLGHFLLQQYIGGGGMGVVFKALDTTLDRIVAVKVVASHRMDSADLQRRFLVEAQSTARLDHPNIARVHYIGRDRGLPYIVFEFIDGVNIRDLTLERGPLPVGEALSYIYQIAHALAHAWQRDVVHRDIKPSNILVTADGQAKLVDMGLARLRQLDDGDEDLTQTGITLGTFDYISPEQARDPRLADARSDIYSLGCTLFYMLVGRAPFANGTALQKLLQHQSERPPDVRQYRSDAPESVSRLLRTMLAKEPEDRHQNPLELADDVAAILEELEVPLPYPAAPMTWRPARRTPRWRRHAAWLVPVAVLLGFALIADRYTRDGATAAPFPPLQPSRADGTTASVTDSLAGPSAAASTPGISAVDAPASPEPSSAANASAESSHLAPDLMPIGPQLDVGNAMWDFVVEGESAAAASGLPLGSSMHAPIAPPWDLEGFPLIDSPAVDLGIKSAPQANDPVSEARP